MRTRLLCFLALAGLLLAATAWPGLAGGRKGARKKADTAAEKEAIAKSAEAFVEAFHKGDAKALAAFWTADGDYTDPTGRHLKGRSAIEKAFQRLFAENKSLKVQINSTSLRFVTPNVAIEDGTTAVYSSEPAPPTRANYTMVHVKKDGRWLISGVRETTYTPPSNYRHLRGLEWLVGEWAGETGKGEIERISFSWPENQNFLTGSFTTTFGNVSIASVRLWIGWDPTAKRIRSWMFDATGGFGEGSWSKDGKSWVVKTTSVHPDGKKAAATFVLTPVDADSMTVQAKDRSVDGKELPDTKAIKLKRVK
jgi:uncharacterized protein (TIGR02246 family)